MNAVLEECDRVRLDFAADPVHDLRVALRRCRSMAAGLMVIDPDKSWKAMKKAGKPLFQALGELRDAQVLMEEVRHLGSSDDLVAHTLLDDAALREPELKRKALAALGQFDHKRWTAWSKELPRRAARVRLDGPVFKHMALERWTEARQLHRLALRGRSNIAWHRLRIGLKRFRYTVENFLPELHQAWKDDLKELQDMLGEVHDLDVIWAKAVELDAFPDAESRNKWQAKITEEREKRIERYREKMVGDGALWGVWREQLPQGKQIDAAALSRLRIWASFLDPDAGHSKQVAALAVQLYDRLAVAGLQPKGAEAKLREVLRVAAMMHDVGRAKRGKNHHKKSSELINRLKPPLGWTAEELKLAGIVARYHRGALPQTRHQDFRHLSAERKAQALHLAGILRLANAFDSTRDGRIRQLNVRNQNGYLEIAAQGYSARDRSAERIAAGRHLLEVVYRRPVMVKPLRFVKRAAAS
jgi:exopolyphosphatase/guanosine-5'-triphosphate,3'-diphosphate pyrophosphatase